MKKNFFLWITVVLLSLFLIACEGEKGDTGSAGGVGPAGSAGPGGTDGTVLTAPDVCKDVGGGNGGFAIQGSVADQNGIGLDGVVVEIGAGDVVQVAETSDNGVYTFCNLQGSQWRDADSNGAWSAGDSIDGMYTIVAKVAGDEHDSTLIIRDAAVGTIVRSGTGFSEDWNHNGAIDVIWECTGTTTSLDEGGKPVHPYDLDGDNIIGTDGSCLSAAQNEVAGAVGTDKAVSEDRNHNGILDVYAGSATDQLAVVDTGTDNYDFIAPETNSELQAIIVDAQTLGPIVGAVVTLERITGVADMAYACTKQSQTINNSFSVPFSTETSGTDGGFTLTGLVSVDYNCDGSYDALNHVTVSATGYQTIQFASTDEVLPRKVYSLGHFNGTLFPGLVRAGTVYLTKTAEPADITAPYVQSVTFNGEAASDGFITSTAPTSIKIRFNEGLMRNLDNIYKDGLIVQEGFAGGDLTSSNLSTADVAAKISYEESESASGIYDVLVIEPQTALEGGYKYKIDLTAVPLSVKDESSNVYAGYIDSDSDNTFDYDNTVPGGVASEVVDALNYGTTFALDTINNGGELNFTVTKETFSYTAPVIVASAADTGNVEFIDPEVNVHVDWSPVLDATGDPAFGYRVWGQAVETDPDMTTDVRTIGPYVELAEINLSYDPPTHMNFATFWNDWNIKLPDTSTTINSFAEYWLENEADAPDDAWTLYKMNVKVGPIDINGLEGTKSGAVQIQDNTPPRIGKASLTAANRNYPFARVTLVDDGNAQKISSSFAEYIVAANSQGTHALTAVRDEYRTDDTSTKHTLTFKFSEPLAKASVNVDANADGIPDNITLSMVNTGFESVDLTSAGSVLYFGSTATVPAITALDGNSVSVEGIDAGVDVNYGMSTSFSTWPGIDINGDTNVWAKAKYQAIVLGFDDIFKVRTGLGVVLGSGITDLHGNAVPANQKIAYLVDGVPPLVKSITVNSTDDFIEVEFTEPIGVSATGLSSHGGLVLNAEASANGLSLDANNPALIAGTTGYTRIGTTAYMFDSTVTKLRMYVNDMSLIPYNVDGRKLVTNTTVSDLAPTVIRYDGSTQFTGYNTVADDAASGTLAGSDDGTYLGIYSGPAGYVEQIGPRVLATANDTGLTLGNTSTISNEFETFDDVGANAPTVQINYTEDMNDSVDRYGDKWDTSICNPARYAVTYTTGSATGASAAGGSASISKVVCNTNKQVTLSLVKSYNGTEDIDVSGSTVTIGGTETNPLIPGVEGFGGLTFADFSVATAGFDRDTTTDTLTNVTARHYISAGVGRYDGGVFYATGNTITMTVELYTSDTSSGNTFELQADVSGDGLVVEAAGSVLNPAHYSFSSAYKLKTISSSGKTTVGKGEVVTVTLTYIKSATATASTTPTMAEASGTLGLVDASDGATITLTYDAGTETNFAMDTLSLTKATGDTITVSGVTDDQGNALDTTNSRDAYTWTYRADADENDDDDTDIAAGFHSLRKDR